MLEVWGRKNSSNVIPVMWVVAELGLEHTRHNVGGSFGDLDTDAYGALNPNRTIPTINDDGLVLWESNAIIRYLSRTYGAGSLWPEDPRSVAQADQWMEWCKLNVMPTLIQAFFGLVRTAKEQQDLEKVAEHARVVGQKMQIFEQHLDGQQFVVGDTVTMGDITIGAASHKFFTLDFERPELPNVQAWYARLCEREAYKTHAMNPFGSSPEEWLALEKGQCLNLTNLLADRRTSTKRHKRGFTWSCLK